MVRIYCDGVFDLFHIGHRTHFKTIKQLYKKVTLIVGVLSDKTTTGYKRVPGQPESVRYFFVETCKYIDVIVKDAPVIVTDDFMERYKIDLVVHAFADDVDFQRQKCFFRVPIDLGKFRRMEYTQGISTSKIISSKLWKEKLVKKDIIKPMYSTELMLSLVTQHLHIEDDSILEISCGYGEFGAVLRDKYGSCLYSAQDRLQDNVTIHLKKYGGQVICADIEKEGLIFTDQNFSWIIARDIDISNPGTIAEIKRVSEKGCLLIGCILESNYCHLDGFSLVLDNTLNNKDGYAKYYHAIWIR